MGMCLEARTIFFYLAITMTEFLLQAIHSIHLAIVKHDVLCASLTTSNSGHEDYDATRLKLVIILKTCFSRMFN